MLIAIKNIVWLAGMSIRRRIFHLPETMPAVAAVAGNVCFRRQNA
jgi:hypothetical protein